MQKKSLVNLKLARKTSRFPAWLPRWLVWLVKNLAWLVIAPLKKRKIRKKAQAMVRLQKALTFQPGEVLQVKGLPCKIMQLKKSEILLQTKFAMSKDHPHFKVGERIFLEDKQGVSFKVKSVGRRVVTLSAVKSSIIQQTGPKIILTDKEHAD